VKWWAAIQPSWRRVVADGELSRAVPPDEKWEGLAKGGTAGICVVVMALSWWIKALGDNPADNVGDAWVAVRDLGWVLTQMKTALTSKIELRGSKRIRDDLNDGVRSVKAKRYSRLPFLVICRF